MEEAAKHLITKRKTTVIEDVDELDEVLQPDQTIKEVSVFES